MDILERIKHFFIPAKEMKQERFEKIYGSMFIDGKLMYPGGLLKRAAQKFPERTALICKEQKITFKDLYARAVGFSEKLKSVGIQDKDRVCLLFENSLEYYIAYYGIWQLGAVIVPLNTFFADRELGHVIEDCKPVLIVSSEDLVAKVDEVNHDSIPVLTEKDFPGPSDKGLDIPSIEPDRLAALLYTSGTTGFPKGVMLSSKNIMYNVAQIVVSVHVLPTDRIFGVLPLFHSFAQNVCVWSSFFLGIGVIVIPKIDRRFITQGLEHKPTIMMGVPAFYGLLCLMKTADLSDVRYFVSGGDALPNKIRAGFELIYRRKLCNGYGLTETSPFIAACLEDELMPTSVIGEPAPGINVKFVNEEGEEVNDEVGVFYIKGANVMLGYFNAPELTDKVLSKDGWFNSGDLARFDAKGRIILCGRKKDLIIYKGFNIYPQEIENVLMSHPLVLRAAVIGKPDTDVGELVMAFVALKEEKDGIEKELKGLCRDKLAGYKVPKQFFVLKDLPVTATAKVNKVKLREEHLKE